MRTIVLVIAAFALVPVIATDDSTVAIVVLLASLAFVAPLVAWIVYQRKRHQLAGGAPHVLERYEGGHPELAGPCNVTVWAANRCVVIATQRWGNPVDRIEIPVGSIAGLAQSGQVQRVNTGGGRSITGAIVGDVIAGPLGAIIGGTRSTQVQSFDDRRAVLTVYYHSMAMQMTFSGARAQQEIASIIALAAAQQPARMVALPIDGPYRT